MTTPPFRLGTVPYLNAAPLVGGLPYPLVRAHPRQLKSQLQAGDVDFALLSTSVLFETPGLYVVPGMGIGCKGPVKSVKLFFNKESINIRNLRKILPSPHSNSANQLTRILFPTADYTVQASDLPDAEVVIGDDALVRPDSFGSIDLGALWQEQTGLPFVFATWISRSPTIPKSLWEILRTTKERNLSDISHCLDHMTEQYPLSRAEQVDYLTHNIHYELGEEELKGLAQFRESCITHQLVSNAHPLQFAKIV